MLRGSCLCGGVRFEIDRVLAMHSCHCSLCRKAHGSAFRAAATVKLDAFRLVAGQELIQTYQASPDGYRATFCRVCGSNAPFASLQYGKAFVPAGLLDDDPGVRPSFHCFVGSKAPWWEITDDARQFEKWPPGFAPEDAR